MNGIAPDAAERYSLRITHGMKAFSTSSFSNPTCAFSPMLNEKSFFVTHPIFFKGAYRAGIFARARGGSIA